MNQLPFTLAEIQGPGAIQHIWMTPTGHLRFSILRIYWDAENATTRWLKRRKVRSYATMSPRLPSGRSSRACLLSCIR